MTFRIQIHPAVTSVECDTAEEAARFVQLLGTRSAQLAAPTPERRQDPPAIRPTAPRALVPSAPVPRLPPAPKPDPAETARVHATGVQTQIVDAFKSDPNFPLTKLAERIYGTADGLTLRKLKSSISQVCVSGKLKRIGAASYRVLRVAGGSEL